jgi:hypothetical protein
MSQPDLRAIGARFQILGAFVHAQPYGTGHINDTFAATYDQAGTVVRYIHQRLNAHVFREPDALMENVARVLSHAATRVGTDRQSSRRALTLVPTREGAAWLHDDDGRVWRTYLFIEGARTYDVIESTAQAEAGARAFGAFQQLLADLPGARLHETIPRFHHTRSRFDACMAAVQADVRNRAAGASDAIAFVQAREAHVDRLLAAHASGAIPERVTHNDTKLNNVMLDEASGEGLCVIDLDTTMPGLAPYDFGDMVRTATNAAAEDERDLSRVRSRPEMFEALARGYLGAAGAFLTPAETGWLTFAGMLMTLECGIRFLADHLDGDTYFRTKREGHNLDRARVQFALVESLEAQFEANERTIQRYARG